jgi:transcriptional regulator with PAS, ATPase and Fis domain
MKTVQNQAFWRDILDEVSSLLFVFRIESDESVHLIYTNEAIKGLLGYTPQDFVMQSEPGGVLVPVVNGLIDQLAEKSHQPASQHRGKTILPDVAGAEVALESSFKLFQSASSRTPLMVVTLDRAHAEGSGITSNAFIAESPHMKDLLGRMPHWARQSQAVWLTGEAGIGKKSLARRYAGMLGKPVIQATKEALRAGVPDGSVLLIEDVSVLKIKDPLPMKGVIGVVASEVSPDAARAKGLLNEAWYFSQNFQVVTVAPLRYRSEDARALVADTLERMSAMLPIDAADAKRIARSTPPEGLGIEGIRRWVMSMVAGAPAEESGAREVRSWEDQTADYLKQVLDSCGGRIYGKDGAAAKLGLKPTTLQSKLKRLNVR